MVRPHPRVLRRTLHKLEFETHPFMAVWSDITHEANALARSQEEAVAELETDAGRVTISAGVVQGVAGTDPLKLADEKLYEAKRTGRNRVCA